MTALELIEGATSLLTNATDSYQLCRDAVHADIIGAGTSGAQLVAIDQRGVIRTIAAYGNTYLIPEELTLWDEFDLSRALASKSFNTFPWGKSFVSVFPFFRTHAPVGGLVMTSAREAKQEIDPATEHVIAQIGAFYLDTNGLNIRATTGPIETHPESLSERQIQVLGFMALGHTNAEIARQMLLSESTIRQETVRIYRNLGVNSRTEASKKAKALGLIPKSGSAFNPPPPA